MKKFLSVFFAVIFILSSLSVMAFAWETECPYCGEKFSTEEAYTEHMKKYNFSEDHYLTCPYSGDDYKDGGCGQKFATKEAYDLHVETCPHNGDYSTIGYVKFYGCKLVDTVKGVAWGDILGSIVSIVKALFGAIDFKEIINFGKTMISLVKG